MKTNFKILKKKIIYVWEWFIALTTTKKILLVGMIGLALFLLRPKADESAVSYQTQGAATGEVSQVVSETGEIMSSGKTDVASTITGIVTEVYTENGDEVKKGTPLFKVESSATAEERSKAYASYLSSKNSLNSAESSKKTYESDMWQAHEVFEADSLDTELSVDDPIFIQTERDWQAAEKKYLDQDEVISQAQAAINSAWFTYQATIDGVVKAPIGGVVANMSVAAGQKVSATDTTLVISSNAETWIKLAVSESDVTTIEPGQSAEVAVDAIKNSSYEAVIKRVDEFGTESSGVVTYNIYLVLLVSSPEVKPSMTVQVDITTQNKSEALIVPNAAVKPYQGSKAVQILSQKNGQPIYVPVEIGIEGDSYTEIISGLKDGQQVIIGQDTGDTQKQSGTGIFPVPGGGGGK
ncbi:MAG: HlyD family efflux transporter periplasmic adaptor subunit [Candidatus Pacebacteria bacterium]|jgi:membrane fusion protein, macrolide-specific efflux system|nr:HlyD family efflux transporter periplasmic adaptor subunit [Candidatus Paceibacterota bacterium]MBT3512231.1 HlyD family efflux transporter periplasmic adaptor subunit [Candidatus Paceibacterota bacterium]MBT4004923.1 HlyD family efflux transporter periplasmic adaptor subunit [Candidatus Paceibacterota bacterium]MBT4358911.1 HlyD family efflux transporter periplasmic adaptor subunit [Candidatus Paceibacterota bacterium]MBT4680769.1 HlyD family efflux transporter periplasmic adaptor subunit [